MGSMNNFRRGWDTQEDFLEESGLSWTPLKDEWDLGRPIEVENIPSEERRVDSMSQRVF